MGNTQKTIVKGLSFGGVTEDSNTVQVDVKDGKIIRIRPFHFNWRYDRESWEIEARGQVFKASSKTLIPPFTLAYKNRINSPNRTMYPLKRVDWNPNGERNPQGEFFSPNNLPADRKKPTESSEWPSEKKSGIPSHQVSKG